MKQHFWQTKHCEKLLRYSGSLTLPCFDIACTSPAKSAARVSEQVEAVAKHLEEQIENSPSLIDRLREVNEETRSILKQAKDAGNNELALKAIARLEKQIELKGRLIGELQGQASGNTTIEVTYVDKQVILRGQQNGGAEPIRAEIREPILIEGTSLDEY